MKRVKIILAALAVLACVGSAHAFRRDGEKAKPVFVDNGNASDRFTVAVGSTTPVAVYSTTTYPQGIRNVEVCNAESFRLYVGTFSTVSGSTVSVVNARDLIPTNTCRVFGPESSLWVIYEAAAGAVSKIVTGAVRWQNND